MPTSDPYDYGYPALKALTEIGNALGMKVPDFEETPGAVEPFGWQAAAIITEDYVRRDTSDAQTETQPDAEPGTQSAESMPVIGDDPDLDDPSVVAVLRLPIDLSDLMPISNLLEQVYGPNLVTGSRSATGARFFVIRRPQTDPDTTDTHATDTDAEKGATDA